MVILSAVGDKKDLKIGQFGYSLEKIDENEHGPCYFDGIRYDVKAGADIRRQAEVVLITLTPEPTVVETWGVFPLSYGLRAGGFKTVDENYPLPVTTASKAITHVTIEATASGNTEIVTPSTGKKIRVHWYSISNKHTTLADIGMRFGASGTIKHKYGLPADGGTGPINLIDANWEGAANEPLYAYLAAAYATGVYFNVGYTEES